MSIKDFLLLTAATAALAFSVAAASSTDYGLFDEEVAPEDFGYEPNLSEMPIPVTGGPLFVVDGGRAALPACVSAAEVAVLLAKEQSSYGGEIVTLTGSANQAFANEWRTQIGAPLVQVSRVTAHILSGNGDMGTAVDVVEFDTSGCAMSRTMMTGEEWLLLTAAGGPPEA